jgi:hypothetical protein
MHTTPDVALHGFPVWHRRDAHCRWNCERLCGRKHEGRGVVPRWRTHFFNVNTIQRAAEKDVMKQRGWKNAGKTGLMERLVTQITGRSFSSRRSTSGFDGSSEPQLATAKAGIGALASRSALP